MSCWAKVIQAQQVSPIFPRSPLSLRKNQLEGAMERLTTQTPTRPPKFISVSHCRPLGGRVFDTKFISNRLDHHSPKANIFVCFFFFSECREGKHWVWTDTGCTTRRFCDSVSCLVHVLHDMQNWKTHEQPSAIGMQHEHSPAPFFSSSLQSRPKRAPWRFSCFISGGLGCHAESASSSLPYSEQKTGPFDNPPDVFKYKKNRRSYDKALSRKLCAHTHRMKERKWLWLLKMDRWTV